MAKPVYDSLPADEFIRKYGKPYDPAADDYDRSPFIADIKEGKNDPIYNAHSYHTKVPPRAIIPYILHYTEPGDIVLDPFCGSGMTGVAALLCEKPPEDIMEIVQAMNPGRKIKPGARRAILNDLSPAACHIAYNYCTPVDVDELRREFERIKAAVKDELDWLYGTEHYEPAVDLYDPHKPEVVARLKNPPPAKGKDRHAKELFKGAAPERTWELISREEVERRTGPEALARSPLLAETKQFICIPAEIQYTIWSDIYRCGGMVSVPVPGRKTPRRAPRGCGGDIVLWDVAVDQDKKKIRESFLCPACSCEWKKTQLKRLGILPVTIVYEFEGLASALPRRTKSPTTTTIRSQRAVSQLDRELIRRVELDKTGSWFPEMSLDTKWPQYQRNALRHKQIFAVADFFTSRNRRAFASLWKSASESVNPRTKAALLFVLTAVLPVCTRRARWPQISVISGTLYIPSFSVEVNVRQKWSSRMDSFCDTLASWPAREADSIAVTEGSATDMSCLPDSSIDYVFADPPFGSNIYYSEMNLLWEAWLGKRTNVTHEAVSHREQDRGFKTLEDYSALMAAAFEELYRVLKPDRFATIEFNNSDGRVFEAIKNGARVAGFDILNMLFLDKDQRSFKQVKGFKGEQDVVGHDVLFNLYKPSPRGRRRAQIAFDGEFDHMVVDTIREHLRSLPNRIKIDPATYSDEHRTTPFLNTMLMNALIPRGVAVDRLNLPFIDALCSRYFRKIDNRWYLPDEVVGNGRADTMLIQPSEVDVTDEVSAIDWLRRLLTTEARMLGEIKPLWMRATVRLTGDLSTQLERILRQNFWLDRATNKWREPTPEERQRMDTSERDRIRHNTDRVLSGALKEVPEDGELCRWIGVLYEAAKAIEEETANNTDETPEGALGIYRQICALFGRVLKEKVAPKMYATAARQSRMAGLRVQHAEEAKPKPAQPKTLFDP